MLERGCRVLGAVVLLAAYASLCLAQTRIPVAVWCGGDDGLTVKVCAAVNDALRDSAEFSPVRVSTERAQLKIEITHNVRWRQLSDGQTEVSYRAAYYTAEGRLLRQSSGKCLDTRLSECGSQVERKAHSLTANNRWRGP